MKSASLKVFCHPDELGQWLDDLCFADHLGWLAFSAGETYGVQGFEGLSGHLGADCRRVFLFPQQHAPKNKLALSDVKSRPWGWMDITPGAMIVKPGSAVLNLTEVDAEEGYSESGAKMCKSVARFKRKARPFITYGVLGRTITNSGRSFYKNIGYTAKAADLHRDGTLWMKLGVNNVAFDPT